MSSSTHMNTMAGGAASPTPDEHGPQLKVAGHVLGASASATDPPGLRSPQDSGLKDATEVDAKVTDGAIGNEDCSAESDVASTGPPAFSSLASVVAQSAMLSMKEGEIAFNDWQLRNEIWDKPQRQIKHRRLLAELDPEKRRQEVTALFRVLFGMANTAFETLGPDQADKQYVLNGKEIDEVVEQCIRDSPDFLDDAKYESGIGQVFKQCLRLKNITSNPYRSATSWTGMIFEDYPDILEARRTAPKTGDTSEQAEASKPALEANSSPGMAHGATPNQAASAKPPAAPFVSGEVPRPDMMTLKDGLYVFNGVCLKDVRWDDRDRTRHHHIQLEEVDSQRRRQEVSTLFKALYEIGNMAYKNNVKTSEADKVLYVLTDSDIVETVRRCLDKLQQFDDVKEVKENSKKSSVYFDEIFKQCDKLQKATTNPSHGDIGWAITIHFEIPDIIEAKKKKVSPTPVPGRPIARKPTKPLKKRVMVDGGTVPPMPVPSISPKNRSGTPPPDYGEPEPKKKEMVPKQTSEPTPNEVSSSLSSATDRASDAVDDSQVKDTGEDVTNIICEGEATASTTVKKDAAESASVDSGDSKETTNASSSKTSSTSQNSTSPSARGPEAAQSTKRPSQRSTVPSPFAMTPFKPLGSKPGNSTPVPSPMQKFGFAAGFKFDFSGKAAAETPPEAVNVDQEKKLYRDHLQAQISGSKSKAITTPLQPAPTAPSALTKQNEDVKAPIADVKPAATPTPTLEDKRQTAPKPTPNGRDSKTESDASDRVPKAQLEVAKPEDVQKTDIAKLVQEAVQSQLKSMKEHFAKEKSGQDMKIEMITKRLVKHETENEKQKKELDDLTDRFVQMEKQHAREKQDQEQKIADLTQQHMKENQEHDRKLDQILKLVKEKAELKSVCSTGAQTESKEPEVQQKPPTAAPNAPKASAKPEIVKTPPKPVAKDTPEDATPKKKASPPAADLASTASKAAKSVQKYHLKVKKPAPVQAPRIVIFTPSPSKDEGIALITTADSAKAVKPANPYADRVAAHPPMASFSSYRISAPLSVPVSAEPSRKLPTWTHPVTRETVKSIYYSDITIVNYKGDVQWEVPMHEDLDKFIAGWNDYLRRLPGSVVSIEDRCIIMQAVKQMVYFAYNWRVWSGKCADKILEALEKGEGEEMDAFTKAGYEAYAQIAAYFTEPFSKSSSPSSSADTIARLGAICKSLQTVMHNTPSAKEQQEIIRCLTILRQKKDATKTELAAVDKKFGIFDKWLVGGMGAKYEKEKLGKELARLNGECCAHIDAYYTKYEAHMNNLQALRETLVDFERYQVDAEGGGGGATSASTIELFEAYERSEKVKWNADIEHMVAMAGYVRLGRWVC